VVLARVDRGNHVEQLRRMKTLLESSFRCRCRCLGIEDCARIIGASNR